MVAPTKPTPPTRPSRSVPSTFPGLADGATLYQWTTLPDYIDEAATFSEAQAAIAEAAAQDLLTTFTDYSGDVDSLTSNGVYKLATGVTNAWAGAGDNDFLFNLYWDANNSVQYGYDGAAVTYIRSKVSGAWGAWGSTSASATTASEGAVELATNAEGTTGTDTSRVPPVSATKSMIGIWSTFTFIGTTDLSGGSTANFTGINSSKFDAYMWVLGNVIPATDSVGLNIKLSDDGGATYEGGASTYRYAASGWTSAAAGSNIASTGATSMSLTGGDIGSASGEFGVSGWVMMSNPHIVARTKLNWNLSYQNDVNVLVSQIGSGERTTALDNDAAQFLFGTGNLESGTITLYGMRNSE